MCEFMRSRYPLWNCDKIKFFLEKNLREFGKEPASCRSTILLISFRSGCVDGEWDFANPYGDFDLSNNGDRCKMKEND